MKKNKFYVLVFKVKTNRPQTKITGKDELMYYIDLAATPVDNKANEELINFVAKEFAVAKSTIDFLSGEKAKIKRLKIYQNQA